MNYLLRSTIVSIASIVIAASLLAQSTGGGSGGTTHNWVVVSAYPTYKKVQDSGATHITEGTTVGCSMVIFDPDWSWDLDHPQSGVNGGVFFPSRYEHNFQIAMTLIDLEETGCMVLQGQISNTESHGEVFITPLPTPGSAGEIPPQSIVTGGNSSYSFVLKAPMVPPGEVTIAASAIFSIVDMSQNIHVSNDNYTPANNGTGLWSHYSDFAEYGYVVTKGSSGGSGGSGGPGGSGGGGGGGEFILFVLNFLSIR